MPTRIHTTSPLVLAIVLAGVLLPASALAQAGITGDAMGPSAGKFDKSFQSKSALGQLEEMTGTTVDRSSIQSSYRSTVTRVAPQPRLAQPRYDPNQQIAGAAAGAIIGALFANVFSDNSAQEQAAAEAAAAQAAAEAEAFRLQQEAARKARIQMAQHYRAEWDSREAEIGDRLGGAFDVTTGTALFGRPANPDADTVAAILGQDVGSASQGPGGAPDVYGSDPSVVDLRGSSMVVQPSFPQGPFLGTEIPPAASTKPLLEDMTREELRAELASLRGNIQATTSQLRKLVKTIQSDTSQYNEWEKASSDGFNSSWDILGGLFLDATDPEKSHLEKYPNHFTHLKDTKRLLIALSYVEIGKDFNDLRYKEHETKNDIAEIARDAVTAGSELGSELADDLPVVKDFLSKYKWAANIDGYCDLWKYGSLTADVTYNLTQWAQGSAAIDQLDRNNPRFNLAIEKLHNHLSALFDQKRRVEALLQTGAPNPLGQRSREETVAYDNLAFGRGAGQFGAPDLGKAELNPLERGNW